MSEKLVLWKWDAWRRTDGWLLLIVPPALAAGARLLEQGPSLWGALAVFLVPLLLPGFSTAIAARFNAGEWVTRDELLRRMLTRMLDGNPVRLLLWMALGAFVWMGSAFAAFIDFSNRDLALWLFGLATLGSLFVAGLRYTAARRQLALLTDAMAEDWPETSVWSWLPGALALRYACTGVAVVIGFFLGRLIAPPYGLFVLAVALWAGLGAESLIRNRFGGRQRPVLWTQGGFGGALLLSLLLFALPFGAWGAVMPVLSRDPTLVVSMVVFGVGMGLFGTLIGMFSWVQARLSQSGPRKQAG